MFDVGLAWPDPKVKPNDIERPAHLPVIAQSQSTKKVAD